MDALFADRFRYVRAFFEQQQQEVLEVTEQDKLLYRLCRPERLLRIVQRYVLFDNGEKKVPRYQQYFTVESGLMIGRDAVQKTPMGDIPVTSTISEYKEFAGTMIPTRTADSMMGMQQIVTIDDVSFEPVADDVFALPAAVAALVEKG